MIGGGGGGGAKVADYAGPANPPDVTPLVVFAPGFAYACDTAHLRKCDFGIM